ncbi:MAG: hypothetical protein ABR615_11805 [Pseudonocardiaceae bacterium]
MTPNELCKALRKSQQLLADIPVQLAGIGIRRKLQTRRFPIPRCFTTALRQRPVTSLNSTLVTPAVLRSTASTSHPLAVRAALRHPFLGRATPRHSVPVLATGAVRIPGRIRSG